MRSRTVIVSSLCVLTLSFSGCMTAIGAFQPEMGDTTLKISTTDAEGESHVRVLSAIDYDNKLYVAANHWPRAWYNRALAHPDVSVTRSGATKDYKAVPVTGDELARLQRDEGFPALAYVLTGFAPRKFLRLDPR